VHSLIAAALRDGDRRIGAVIVGRDRTRRPFGDDDRALLQDVVDRASMAIARSRPVRVGRARPPARVGPGQRVAGVRRGPSATCGPSSTC
jgi:GAF domain-containing protein